MAVSPIAITFASLTKPARISCRPGRVRRARDHWALALRSYTTAYRLELDDPGCTHLVSGSATIKLPSLPATISVSETFVFTSVLLFGPAAGTMTVALDALVISLWAYQRKRAATVQIAIQRLGAGTNIWLASQIFFLSLVRNRLVLNPEPINSDNIVFPLARSSPLPTFCLNSGSLLLPLR